MRSATIRHGPSTRLARKYRIGRPIERAMRTRLPRFWTMANWPSMARIRSGSPEADRLGRLGRRHVQQTVGVRIDQIHQAFNVGSRVHGRPLQWDRHRACLVCHDRLEANGFDSVK